MGMTYGSQGTLGDRHYEFKCHYAVKLSPIIITVYKIVSSANQFY